MPATRQARVGYLIVNAGRLWMELALAQKQQLQRVIFPEALRFDGERFGTAITCLPFKQFGESRALDCASWLGGNTVFRTHG
jgi:hypothetical protein